MLKGQYANNWYFGNSCGISFSSTPPAISASAAINTAEGSSSISDASGNLLFYTDGLTVWNRQHQVMANGTGLDGSKNATQAALIVQKPGSTSEYLIFTLGEPGPNMLPYHLSYSQVDMSLAAGLGSVTTKNTLLQSSVNEKLNGTFHCNGSDIWILAHGFNSNVFFAYLLNSGGLTTSPVTSSIGVSHSLGGHQGQLKLSPTGNLIGLVFPGSSVAPQYIGFAEVLRFNRSTGVVSSPTLLASINGYGCEFSGDESKFYSEGFTDVPFLSQWDLCAGSSAAISASQYTIASGSQISSLQLAPNGKIYFTSPGSPALGVIGNPDLPGAACGFSPNALSVLPGSLAAGLPNFVSGFYIAPFSPISFSFNTSSCQTFSFVPGKEFFCQKLLDPQLQCAWDFGDPASGAANTATQTSPVHQFSSSGNHTVTLSYQSTCSIRSTTQIVSVMATPLLLVNGSTAATVNICKNTMQVLTASGAQSYTWLPFATSSHSVLVNAANSGSVLLKGLDSTSGCTAEKQVFIKISDCLTLAEGELRQRQHTILPNPNDGRFVVTDFDFEAVEIVDCLGRNVPYVSESFADGCSITITAKGVFFLHLPDGDICKVIVY